MAVLRPQTCAPCPPACNPFTRVVVSYLIRGGTSVFWELSENYVEPGPYQFQLQVGQSANQNADDWTDVGGPVTDIFYSVDGEQRLYGKIRYLFYRVKLTLQNGTVLYSDPTGLMGTLARRDWRLARESMRQEIQYMKNGDGQLCDLLKRRVTGTPCPNCLDWQTEEIRQPYCNYCWGTGFLCGYFYPIGCVWADIAPKAFHLNQSPQKGTTADIAVKARMANIWMLSEDDVVVQRATDDRFYVHSVTNVSEFRGVPTAATVELRLAPYSDPIYDLPMPDQPDDPAALDRGD